MYRKNQSNKNICLPTSDSIFTFMSVKCSVAPIELHRLISNIKILIYERIYERFRKMGE